MMLDWLIRILGRHAWRNYSLASLYFRLRLYRTLSRAREIVPVYQMGKVGSATVTNSLRKYAPELAVFHVHNLEGKRLRSYHKWVRDSYSQPLVTPAQRSNTVEHWVAEYHLVRQLERNRVGRKWKVITLVRDPVARNLSSFFEIIDREMGYGLKDHLARRGMESVVGELCVKFLDDFPGHDQPLEFFDEELKASLGIDVYATSFERENGYQIYPGPQADVLLLRLEDLNRYAAKAFGEFLGLSNFEIDNRNVGAEKDYAEVYRAVRRAIRLPDSYLRRMYTSRYATHFYSAAELTAFEARWRTLSAV